MKILWMMLVLFFVPVGVSADGASLNVHVGDCRTELNKDDRYQDLSHILTCLAERLKNTEANLEKLKTFKGADLNQTNQQQVSPLPDDAPKYSSGGLVTTIANLGVQVNEQRQESSVTVSVNIQNNNDYDLALLNVEGFLVTDDAGNSWSSQSTNASADGVTKCYSNLSYCLDKTQPSYFVPYNQYTVVSAHSLISATYSMRCSCNSQKRGKLFTFATKMNVYKADDQENEGDKKTKVLPISVSRIHSSDSKS